MSAEALAWALRQRLEQPSAKLTLLVLANCADPRTGHLSASIDYLSDSTSLNRKTVLLCLRRLLELGLIETTGERTGPTGRTPVYRLAMPADVSAPHHEAAAAPAAASTPGANGPENGTIDVSTVSTNAGNRPESGPITPVLDGEIGPKVGPSAPPNRPEIGSIGSVNRPKNGPIAPAVEPREGGTIGGMGEEVLGSKTDTTSIICLQNTQESGKGGAGGKPSRSQRAAKLRNLADWLAFVRSKGERAIPADDPVYTLADSIGLDPEMVRVQWHHFRTTYTEDRDRKTYIDWRQAFRNSVRANWFRLWTIDPITRRANWTSNGLQARSLFLLEQAQRQQHPQPPVVAVEAAATSHEAVTP